LLACPPLRGMPDMILLVLSYLARVLTIASPCILAVLPFVFARPPAVPAQQSPAPPWVDPDPYRRRRAGCDRRCLGNSAQCLWPDRGHGSARHLRRRSALAAARRNAGAAAGCPRQSPAAGRHTGRRAFTLIRSPSADVWAAGGRGAHSITDESADRARDVVAA